MERYQSLDDSHRAEPGSVTLPRIEVGNRQRDKSTDTSFIPIFGLCVGFTMLLLIVHLPQADFHLEGKVMDSDARVCGVDPEVKDYPYLYMVKFDEKYRSVCVTECPKLDYHQIMYNSENKNKSKIELLYFDNLGITGRSEQQHSDSEDTVFDFDQGVAEDRYSKQQYDSYLQRFALNCKVNNDIKTCKHDAASKMYIYDTRPHQNMVCKPVSKRLLYFAPIFTDFQDQPIYEFGSGKYVILASIGTCMLMCLFFGTLVSCCMTCMLWTSIVIGSAISALLGWGLIIIGSQGSNPYISPVLEGMSKEPFIIGPIAGFIKSKLLMTLLSGVTCILVAIAMPINAVVRHKAVRTSAQLLESADKVIIRRSRLLILALATFLVMIPLVIYLYWGAYTIYYAGSLVRDVEMGRPFAEFSMPIYRKFLIYTYVLGSLWIILAVANVLDWISTDTAIVDYFQASEQPVKEAIQNLRPHLGSTLLGGLIFFPLAIIRIVLTPFYLLFSMDFVHPYWLKLKTYVCYNDWYYRYVLRLNEQAYAMQALLGHDLIPSAKLYHHLEVRCRKIAPYSDTIIFGFTCAGVLFTTLLNQWIAHILVGLGWLSTGDMQSTAGTYYAVYLLSIIQSAVFMRLFYSAALGIGAAYYLQIDRKVAITHDIMKNAPRKGEFGGYTELLNVGDKKDKV